VVQGILGLFIVAILFYVIFSQHRALIDGCHRGAVSSSVQAQLWRTAADARLEAFKKSRDRFDYDAAVQYAKGARLFERRAKIDCADAYPLVSV
jgi:hypothetical protein